MSEELPKSQDRNPNQAFNFAVMTDDQVMLLGRSTMLGIKHEQDRRRIERGGRGIVSDLEIGGTEDEGVLDLYIGGMTLLLDRDPDRAKRLLKRQTLSEDQLDEIVSIRCAPTLARFDFGLARDIFAYTLNGVLGSYGSYAVVAAYKAMRQIEEHASPDQIADLQAAKVAADAVLPRRPILPGLAT